MAKHWRLLDDDDPVRTQLAVESILDRPYLGRDATQSSAQTQRTAQKADAIAIPQPPGTLLCPECRVPNDPAEWYCERCGGDMWNVNDSSKPAPPPIPSATVEVLDLGDDASARWDSSNGAWFKLWIEQRGCSLSVDDKGITAFMGYAEEYLKGVFHPHYFTLNASLGVLHRGDEIELEWEPSGGIWCSIRLGKQGVRKLADFVKGSPHAQTLIPTPTSSAPQQPQNQPPLTEEEFRRD